MVFQYIGAKAAGMFGQENAVPAARRNAPVSGTKTDMQASGLQKNM